jgi:hypothetical protein
MSAAMAIAASPPPAVQLVAQRFAQTTRGIVSFRLRRTFDVHAGFSSRHEELVMDGVYQDGAVVKVRIATYTIDGKPADATTRASVVGAWEHPKPTDLFRAPFDPRYVGEYQYQISGPQRIAFSSTVHDAAHGNGNFTYDANDNVLSCTYQPNVLPPHARYGQVTDRRAEVFPGYWAVTQEAQEYKGSYGPFPGAGVVQMTYAQFRRFGDLQSAVRAI